jgi:hypothetical protein
MKRLIKQSAYLGYFNVNNQVYNIYKNPSSREVGDINSDGSDLRGVIHPDGTVYAWPGEIYHLIFLNGGVTIKDINDKIVKDIIVDGSSLTITYDPTYIDGVAIAGAHGDILLPSEIINRMAKCKSVLNNISKNIFINSPEFGHMKYETALKHIDIIDGFTIDDDDYQSIKFIDDSNFDLLYNKNDEVAS